MKAKAMYTLLVDIPGHARGSTVLEDSLLAEGYEVPALEAEKARTDMEKLAARAE